MPIWRTRRAFGLHRVGDDGLQLGPEALDGEAPSGRNAHSGIERIGLEPGDGLGQVVIEDAGPPLADRL